MEETNYYTLNGFSGNASPTTPEPYARCTVCGAALEKNQAYCANCGSAAPQPQQIRRCGACQAELQPDQLFCPHCGARTDGTVPAPKQERKKSRIGLFVAIGLIAVLIVLGVILIPQPGETEEIDSIELSDSQIELEEGETYTVECTVFAVTSRDDRPYKLDDADVKWTSSDKNVATVSRGRITAVGEGTCTITAKAEGEKATLRVTVIGLPDLQGLYEEMGAPYYCDIASDGTYLSVDTNWLDIDDHFDSEAYYGLEEIIEKLGLPESLFQEMGETRAMDGRLSEEFDHLTVSWSYHPDNGLEVLFKIKK